MRIAIIGAGQVGRALGTGWLRAGHEIVYGMRDPTKGGLPDRARGALIAPAIASGEVVVLAVPFWEIDRALQGLPPAALDGKLLLDVTNPLTPEKAWARGFSTSGAEELARRFPGAKVAKGINTVFADAMDGGRRHGERLSAFVAADDPAARATVLRLAGELGLDPVDAGPLAAARLLEAAGALMVHLGAFTPTGWDIGLRLVHPATRG